MQINLFTAEAVERKAFTNPSSDTTRIFTAVSAAVLLLLLSMGFAQQAHAQTWTLQWSDEFNGAAGTFPNSSNWTYDLGNSGFGNPEIENYCAPGSNTAPCVASQPNAFQDGNGNLVIEAIRDSSGQWTSARLKTQGLQQFQYGRIEARMKLPAGDGFWPAFWMLGADINSDPWPGCGEQDLMEWVQSYTPTTTSSTVHGPGYSGANGIGAEVTFPNGGRIDDANYHVYGVIWSQNSMQYYRDSPSNVFKTVTSSSIPAGDQWVFNNPFFILLNFAIGDGGFPGSTDSSTPSSGEMLVDYVRVYQASAAKSLNGTHTLTPQNSTGLRLDDAGAKTTSGNPIDVFTANGTGAQSWSISNANVSPAGYYNLATEGAFCLTASGTASGSAVVLEPCNGSSAQAWNAVSTGSTYEFNPANNPSNCLDVRGDGTASGTLVQTFSCNSGPNEQWAVN
jgi:beta-glucanase (GH16 family)